MGVKRRRFLQTLAVVPAAPVLAQRSTVGGSPVGQAPAKLATGEMDAEAKTTPRFFSAAQFATLRRLAPMFMPARKGYPGALEAGAPEFVDFLIGVSPQTQKDLYRKGLDGLDARARSRFHKSFAELDESQADAIVKPLVVTIAWVLDRPSDPMEHFIAQVHDDLRTATVNSLEWANAAATVDAGRRGRGNSVGLYIRPIDPVYRG